MHNEPKRRPDGRYLIWVRIAPGPKGRIPAYGANPQAARERAAAIGQAYADEPVSQTPLPTWPEGSFADFVYNVWTPHVYGSNAQGSPKIKGTTKAKYNGLVTNHLLPAPVTNRDSRPTTHVQLAYVPIAKIGYDEALDLRNSIRRHDGREGQPSDAHIREVMMRFREIMGLYRAIEGAKGVFVREDWKVVSVPEKPKKKKLKTPPVGYTLEILKVATFSEKGLILGAGVFGLRRGEIAGLMKSRIDRVAMTLTIDKQRHPLLGEAPADTKSDERIIPLTPGLLAKLDELADPRSIYVFTNEDGRPWRPDAITERIPQLCERAGVKRSTTHELRHYAASNLALMGTPGVIIQEILGHTEFNTTDIYLHGRDAEKGAALDSLLSMWTAPEEKAQ